jgi:LDH2 family malate/lactate/ureidoglycolate dehydrogenase
VDGKAVPTVTRVAPAAIRVDARHGFAFPALNAAIAASRSAAAETGVAVAMIGASHHCGVAGHHVERLAEHGLVALLFANTPGAIAPWGGARPVFGTNPIAFACPRQDAPPLVIDLSMSVVARGKIRAALQRGERIPETWATDSAGNPTADPKAALDGFLLPFGGYKGYGLALVVDLLAGVLSGAAYLTHVNSWLDDPGKPGNLGHFFMCIDTRVLGPTGWLAERMADFDAIVHGTPRADAAVPVRLPGEIELERMERHRRDGVAIDATLVARLEAIAAKRA